MSHAPIDQIPGSVAHDQRSSPIERGVDQLSRFTIRETLASFRIDDFKEIQIGIGVKPCFNSTLTLDPAFLRLGKAKNADHLRIFRAIAPQKFFELIPITLRNSISSEEEYSDGREISPLLDTLPDQMVDVARKTGEMTWTHLFESI